MYLVSYSSSYSMEKHVQRKVNNYCTEYRSLFLAEIDQLIHGISKGENSDIVERINEIKMKCTFIPFPEIKKGELKKTKRIHNIVPENEKCGAVCSGGVQCSRRKQSGSVYCGTHAKGQPNGTVSVNDCDTVNSSNNELQTIEIGKKVKYVYPVNENGIIKLYLDEDKSKTINVNEFMNTCKIEK